MTYTAAQRKHTAARLRALALQAEKVRRVVPEGFRLAPVDAVAVPFGRYSYATLAELVGVQDLAGFVLAATCRTRCWVYGSSCPVMTHTKAWGADAYRCKEGDRIELEGVGRTSIGIKLAKLFPLVRGTEPWLVPVPVLDVNGLPSEELPPPPWEVTTPVQAGTCGAA